MTGKAKINFRGARELYLCEFESVDQTKKMKTKKGLRPKIYAKFYEIQCEFKKVTKKQFLLTNARAISTILGVLGFDLHSSSPKPVNFFGEQSSLGEQIFVWGGTSSHLGCTARFSYLRAGKPNPIPIVQ